jgi:hypothetical protein
MALKMVIQIRVLEVVVLLVAADTLVTAVLVLSLSDMTQRQFKENR